MSQNNPVKEARTRLTGQRYYCNHQSHGEAPAKESTLLPYHQSLRIIGTAVTVSLVVIGVFQLLVASFFTDFCETVAVLERESPLVQQQQQQQPQLITL